MPVVLLIFLFFFNDTATTEIYTLSLHDALPISGASSIGNKEFFARLAADITRLIAGPGPEGQVFRVDLGLRPGGGDGDRKSTRLNSSHVRISYAVFCLKKKKRRELCICGW